MRLAAIVVSIAPYVRLASDVTDGVIGVGLTIGEGSAAVDGIEPVQAIVCICVSEILQAVRLGQGITLRVEGVREVLVGSGLRHVGSAIHTRTASFPTSPPYSC